MNGSPETHKPADAHVHANELEHLRAECARLSRENAELRASLGLDARAAEFTSKAPTVTDASPAEAKIALFRRLFRGREDVYAVRWEGKAGRSGYAPACANEWKKALCAKPAIKCGECPQRELLPLANEVLRDHFTGRQTIGLYPLLPDETCWFLIIDFDKAAWRSDVAAFLETCDSVDVPGHLEISRSGEGAHVWLFFEQPLGAQLTRKLGCALLTRTTACRHEVGLDSYDRLFPNQDTLPKGGFGNLIALPLQRQARAAGRTVFVGRDLVPFADQWEYLSRVRPLTEENVHRALALASFDGDELGERILPEDDEDGSSRAPWLRSPSGRLMDTIVPGPLPKAVRVVLGNLAYIENDELPQALLDRLVRLAAFENPEFYRSQAMRLPTYDKPRLISCAEELPHYIGLPRGCLEAAVQLLSGHGIEALISDQREAGQRLNVSFHGALSSLQSEAAETMLAQDIGVLCAATAFGKTVVAAWLIAQRATNTLVFVHRRQLMDQWRERLATFLDLRPKEIGAVGGGRSRPTGMIDVAVIQSLNKRGVIDDLISGYGQIVVDECHHVSAFSFEGVLKQAKARYVVGLTATPLRRDGHHPIIAMQCGPIRFRTDRKSVTVTQPFEHIVVPHHTGFNLAAAPASQTSGVDPIRIQAIYNALAADTRRNDLIIADVLSALKAGRSPLLLTERTEHRDTLATRLMKELPERPNAEAAHIFVISGGMGAKKRREITDAMAATPPNAPRVVVATGRCIGEGFDDARLDTLFLAMPIAWRGTLQQYAGRLHREHGSKDRVVIHDYVDDLVPVLARMYEKRLRGYRAMGYSVGAEE